MGVSELSVTETGRANLIRGGGGASKLTWTSVGHLCRLGMRNAPLVFQREKNWAKRYRVMDCSNREGRPPFLPFFDQIKLCYVKLHTLLVLLARWPVTAPNAFMCLEEQNIHHETLSNDFLRGVHAYILSARTW